MDGEKTCALDSDGDGVPDHKDNNPYEYDFMAKKGLNNYIITYCLHAYELTFIHCKLHLVCMLYFKIYSGVGQNLHKYVQFHNNINTILIVYI